MLVLLRAQGNSYQWYATDPVTAEVYSSEGGDLVQLAASLQNISYQLCLLVPGEKVNSALVTLPSRERRHMREAIPGQLEDVLLGSIEEIHFAFGAVFDLQEQDEICVPVAWCDGTWLLQSVQAVSDAGLELRHAVPDYFLLTRREGWTLRLDHNLIVHVADGLGFSVDKALASTALELLCAEHGAPTELRLCADSQQQLHSLEALLPSGLTSLAEGVCEPWWKGAIVCFAADSANSGVYEQDLLQGDFAPRLPVARWWSQWRSAAAILCTAAAAWAIDTGLDIERNSEQQSRYQAQIESSFRQVIPKGQLVDAEKQLRHQLNRLSGDTSYEGPVSLIARIAPLLAEGDGIELQGLSYSARQGDLRLNCHAQSFAGLEQLRGKLVEAGLDAELVHSSADGDGQQARFRIGWGQI